MARIRRRNKLRDTMIQGIIVFGMTLGFMTIFFSNSLSISNTEEVPVMDTSTSNIVETHNYFSFSDLFDNFFLLYIVIIIILIGLIYILYKKIVKYKNKQKQKQLEKKEKNE